MSVYPVFPPTPRLMPPDLWGAEVLGRNWQGYISSFSMCEAVLRVVGHLVGPEEVEEQLWVVKLLVKLSLQLSHELRVRGSTWVSLYSPL